MHRFLGHAKRGLDKKEKLHLLDTFASTVFEDRSLYDVCFVAEDVVVEQKSRSGILINCGKLLMPASMPGDSPGWFDLGGELDIAE
jgi:hypothetical protein